MLQLQKLGQHPLSLKKQDFDKDLTNRSINFQSIQSYNFNDKNLNCTDDKLSNYILEGKKMCDKNEIQTVPEVNY